MGRRLSVALSILVVLHCALLVYSAHYHSPTPDEIGHVVAGFSHWQMGDFSLYRVNPPLARMVGTLPVYLMESNDEWKRYYVDPGDFGRTEFLVANQFLYVHRERFLEWVTYSRIGSIPFSVGALFICFFWARDLYGEGAGIASAVIWCFSPFVLGFGAIFTPDVPSATMGALSIFFFTRWLSCPTWVGAYVSGITLGLAELTKSTWIVLPPLFSMFVAFRLLPIALLHNQLTLQWKRVLSMLGCQFSIAWLVLAGGYGFDDIFHPLGSYSFRSHFLAGSVEPGEVSGNRFRGSFLESVPIPLPRQYVVGMDLQKHDSYARNQPTFIFDHIRQDGVWYYYLFALSCKSTLGTIALCLIAMLTRLLRRSSLNLAEWMMISVLMLVMVLLSSHIGLNKHSRYLLPIIPPVIVWSSQCVGLFVSTWAKRGVTFLLICGVLSSLSVYPHSMSYFNELWGSAHNGRFYLSNSNIDWNQDLYILKHELNQRGWAKVGLVCHANYDVRILGFDFFVPPPAPLVQSDRSQKNGNSHTIQRLQPGKYAVSVCHWQGYPVSVPTETGGRMKPHQDAFSYFRDFTPVGRVAFSILLFDISQEDIHRTTIWRTE